MSLIMAAVWVAETLEITKSLLFPNLDDRTIKLMEKSGFKPFSGIISVHEDPSLRIESSATINLCGVSTKLNLAYYLLRLKFDHHRNYVLNAI